MRVLITDTETTGLSPEDGAVCIEVAAMVYDTKFGPIESKRGTTRCAVISCASCSSPLVVAIC